MNDFEKLMKNPIVDELWESEKEEFELYVIRKNKKDRIFHEDVKLDGEISNFVKNNLPKDKILEYEKMSEEYSEASTKEIEYWIKKYFRVGFFDGIRFYNEIKDYMSEKIEKKDSFFDYKYNCFTEYIENIRIKQLKNNKEYKEFNNQIAKIKEKYPRIDEFLENETPLENFSKEEQKATLEVIDLQEQILNLEDREVFKLGAKEILNFLFKNE